MSFAMRSVSITHSAMNRWILRSEELAAASLSNAAASFVRHLLHFAKGAYHHAHNLDSGEVHRFTEMGVENTG